MFVYDKAKYHHGSIAEQGLPEEHAENHTVFFLRWLVENNLMSKTFLKESNDVLSRYNSGAATIHDVYRWWDTCLISDMLSKKGNEFARFYFDFDNGAYMADYIEVLQKQLPSEFHVTYSEDNYLLLKKRIEQRYQEWLTVNANKVSS